MSASQDGKLIVWDSYSTNKVNIYFILFYFNLFFLFFLTTRRKFLISAFVQILIHNYMHQATLNWENLANIAPENCMNFVCYN